MEKDSKKNRSLTDKEKTLWEIVKESIQPLSGKMLDKRKVVPKVSQKKQTVSPEIKSEVVPSKRHERASSFAINTHTLRQLKRGKLSFDAQLDLHGMTQDAAFRMLLDFVERAYQQQKRVLLIITGKGAGILQKSLPLWLEDSRFSGKIVGVRTSYQQDGGSGAYYVILKKKK
ncbi:MAG: hypothetical protein HOI80_04095 [Alphaproteobacteria bacterium]|jgi:DNA-nicking Smr family endonuclease|nr:hypothetical protein [Alphaproteobacteria bacterium]MBT5390108.1 hypothetical protein [Alphaproteobacteria bacterium]MBT5540834.1 hypothetical protein [Alphaproteobacteria bacterium]MBT5654667.1 hypothetical protein [Alphaproteobacteria bacterium]